MASWHEVLNLYLNSIRSNIRCTTVVPWSCDMIMRLHNSKLLVDSGFHRLLAGDGCSYRDWSHQAHLPAREVNPQQDRQFRCNNNSMFANVISSVDIASTGKIVDSPICTSHLLP